MITNNFQLILTFCASALVLMSACFAIYCRKKSKSFVHTGRVTDVVEWHTKSTLSWIFTFFILLAIIVPVIL